MVTHTPKPAAGLLPTYVRSALPRNLERAWPRSRWPAVAIGSLVGLVLLFMLFRGHATTSSSVASGANTVMLEREKARVVRQLRSINAKFNMLKGVEVELQEQKGALIKQLDACEEEIELVLAGERTSDRDAVLREGDGDAGRRREGHGASAAKVKRCVGGGHECARYREFDVDSTQAAGNASDFGFLGGKPKVYVYNLHRRFNKDLTRKYKRCSKDQYGTEVRFHEELLKESNGYLTKHAEEADFFYVPIYGECFLWQYEMLKKESHEKSFELTNQLFLDALNIVRQAPYWEQSGGRDHVFVFPGARGPTIFTDWESEIKHAIFLTPEGDRKAKYFNTWKDIVIPGLESDPMFFSSESRDELTENEFGAPKKYLAFFRGTINHRDGWAYSRGLRPRLQNIFRNVTDIIYDTKHSTCDRKCYRKEMSQSKFCLNPLGWTPWTLRFYQALMVRCIPVMIADDIEFPYENEIDYSKFSLKIRENDVDNIIEIMRSMPEEELERRRAYIDKIWMKYTYQTPSQPGDAFNAVMKELARKKLALRNSATRSWT